MSDLVTKRFWTDTAERAVRTAAQAAIGFLGSTAVYTSVTEADWGAIPWEAGAGGVLLATVLSVLFALAGRQVGDPSTASLTSGTAPGTISGGGGPLGESTTRPHL